MSARQIRSISISFVTSRRCRTMRGWRDGTTGCAPITRSRVSIADAPVKTANRAPFDAALCAVVEEIRPKVVSFHFGLPEDALLSRVRAAGCKIFQRHDGGGSALARRARRRCGDREDLKQAAIAACSVR